MCACDGCEGGVCVRVMGVRVECCVCVCDGCEGVLRAVCGVSEC